MSEQVIRYVDCQDCGSEIEPPDRQLLSCYCKKCGDKRAVSVRKGWTVLTPHKQGPMFFTAQSARVMAKGINNKGGLVR
jgi:hypothetical protein